MAPNPGSEYSRIALRKIGVGDHYLIVVIMASRGNNVSSNADNNQVLNNLVEIFPEYHIRQ